MVHESESQVKVLTDLDFGKCTLALQAPIKAGIKDPKQLAGGRIVTSFPTLTKKYFEGLAPEKSTAIKFVSGSVEVACALGLADGIGTLAKKKKKKKKTRLLKFVLPTVDLVETGTTMRAAGLEIIATVMKTEAVLISNPHTKHTELVDKLSKRYVFFFFFCGGVVYCVI